MEGYGFTEYVVFSYYSTRSKKKRLSDDFSIAMTVELEQEVNDMCNLSQGIVEYGIEQGELKKAKEVVFLWREWA